MVVRVQQYSTVRSSHTICVEVHLNGNGNGKGWMYIALLYHDHITIYIEVTWHVLLMRCDTALRLNSMVGYMQRGIVRYSIVWNSAVR